MKISYAFFSKTWLRSGLVTALATSLSFGLQAQTAPAIQWEKTFGGNALDEFSSLDQTTDGGYILGGWSQSGISGDKSQISRFRDFWVVRLNASGNKIWDKSIGGFNGDYLSSLQQTSDGGFILAGDSESGWDGDKTQINRGGDDYWVVKLNASGNKMWDKTFGGSNYERLGEIHQTTDGGYILGGSSPSGISGDKTEASKGKSDYWIVKIDASGNKLWDKTLGGSEDDYLTCIRQTYDGGYIMAGRSYSPISGDKSEAHKGGYDFWVVKLDNNGNKEWDKTYGGNAEDSPESLHETIDGGYIIGGRSTTNVNGDKTEPSKGSYDFWIVKTDDLGNKQWDRSLGGNYAEGIGSLKQTSDGGYILGGYSDSNLSGDKSQNSKGMDDFWVVRLNQNGVKLWDKSIGGSDNDNLASLKQTSDGGFVLGGISRSPISGDKNQPCQGYSDYWIVKLGPEILGTNEPINSFNLSLSPNPNQGKFKLQLTNLKAAKAELTVTDLLGRKVLQKELQVTDQQVSEELSLTTAKGMYVLQVKAGEEVTSQKIVVE